MRCAPEQKKEGCNSGRMDRRCLCWKVTSRWFRKVDTAFSSLYPACSMCMWERLASVLWINANRLTQKWSSHRMSNFTLTQVGVQSSQKGSGPSARRHSQSPTMQPNFFFYDYSKRTYELFNYDTLLAERRGVKGKWGGCRVDKLFRN